jgi:plasmid stability protein
MASITIRNLDESLKRRLKLRAAQHGNSMEEEAREILKTSILTSAAVPHMYDVIRATVAPYGGIELLEYPRPRTPTRPIVTFD